MQPRVLTAGAVLAGVSMTLFGCGSGGGPSPTDAPAPAPYDPTSVRIVWDNHFDAFGSADLDKIMWDYDETSKVSIFNDACAGGQYPGDGNPAVKVEGLVEFQGTEAIRGMFESLFAQLEGGTVEKVGPKEGGPVVLDEAPPTGNVFLTWRTTDLPDEKKIEYATDTFSFRVDTDGKYKIDKQNIVTTELVNADKPCQADVDATNPQEEDTGIYAAWNNHFTAFGNADVPGIMADYVEDSIVQLFDNREEKYTEFKGLEAIEGMFTTLFAEIEAAKIDGDAGIGVPLQQVEKDTNTVFLVWKANSHPKATDTFVFNAENKIIRQNIVVQTKAASSVVQV